MAGITVLSSPAWASLIPVNWDEEEEEDRRGNPLQTFTVFLLCRRQHAERESTHQLVFLLIRRQLLHWSCSWDESGPVFT